MPGWLRQRIPLALAFALALGSGLACRYGLHGFFSKYGGVALYACMVYVLVLMARPTSGTIAAAVATLVLCFGIEILQLTWLPAWLSARHLVLRLVFGTSFHPPDFLAYAAGTALAAAVHAACK